MLELANPAPLLIAPRHAAPAAALLHGQPPPLRAAWPPPRARAHARSSAPPPVLVNRVCRLQKMAAATRQAAGKGQCLGRIFGSR
jgi:hypothetical protein